MTDSPMVKALTVKRRIGEVLTELEIEVWIPEKDVYDIAARLCKNTYPGFYLAGYTCFSGHYYFVSRLIQ